MKFTSFDFKKEKYKYALEKTKDLIKEKRKIKKQLLDVKNSIRLASQMPTEYKDELIKKLIIDRDTLLFKLENIKKDLIYFSNYLKFSKGKEDFSNYKKKNNSSKSQITIYDGENMEKDIFDFPIPVTKYVLLKNGNVLIAKTETLFKFYKQKLNKVYSYTSAIYKSDTIDSFDNMEELEKVTDALFERKKKDKTKLKTLEALKLLKNNFDKFVETLSSEEKSSSEFKELFDTLNFKQFEENITNL